MLATKDSKYHPASASRLCTHNVAPEVAPKRLVAIPISDKNKQRCRGMA